LKQRTGDPWMPAARYGRELPTFTVNLLVRDVPRAASFYTKIFAATVHYADPATTKAHGWREVMVEDVDGYLWAVGLPTTPEK